MIPPRICFLALVSFIAIMIAVDVAQAGKFNKVLDVDAPAPNFIDLQGTDGKRYKLADYQDHDFLVLFFTDNHCPATRLYAPRLRALLKEFEKDSVTLIAVNVSNESLESMRAHAAKRKWSFDYLRDPSQQIGQNYGAVRTPQFFVLDRKRKIAYMGALDNNDDVGKVTKRSLHGALRALLSGKRPTPGETLQRGCKIEYADKAGP
jgi:peroxiredoxin